MCGIAGYTDFSYGEPLPQVLAVMARALARRGPDGHGTLVDGVCGLAHTRLSIIDIAGSPQPMRVVGSDVSLVYNGELYNYQELRAEMQRGGERFVTDGDTEVVLRSIDREWERALPRFDGMFGFAAWDRRRERLLLARDSLGEKPVFYANPSPGVLVFGSELKAVLAYPGVDDELDMDALRQAVRFRAVYGDRSLYRGIQQLQPGSYLEFSREGLRVGQFYAPVDDVDQCRDRIRQMSERELINHGERLFLDSVRQRMIADVPVGAFLSGGLDSSLIVAAMRRLRGSAQIHTFSVGFNGDPFSELPHAKLVAEVFGTNHTEVHVGEDEYIARLAELTACRDAPISEPSDVAIAQMSKVARQSVKVVLSGEGSDEVFGGYPKYAFAGRSSLIRWAIRTVGASRTAKLASICGLDGRRAAVAARALAPETELGRLVQWFSYLDRDDLVTLLPGLEWDDAAWAAGVDTQRKALMDAKHWTRLSRMQFVDCMTWLPGNLLERGDRMTMAEGLEARPPFLDRELVAFGLALPDRMRLRGRKGKWIVREWGRKLLPRQVLSRQKWGFRVPLANWFRGGLREALHDYLGSTSGLCGRFGNKAKIERLLADHDSGQIDANLTLWTLLVTEVWYQDVFLRRGSHAVRTHYDMLA